MTSKSPQANQKPYDLKPVRKMTKGATETGRLFIDINDANRRTQKLPSTRYVE